MISGTISQDRGEGQTASWQGFREFIQGNQISPACEDLESNKSVDEVQNLSLQENTHKTPMVCSFGTEEQTRQEPCLQERGCRGIAQVCSKTSAQRSAADKKAIRTTKKRTKNKKYIYKDYVPTSLTLPQQHQPPCYRARCLEQVERGVLSAAGWEVPELNKQPSEGMMVRQGPFHLSSCAEEWLSLLANTAAEQRH